MSNNFHYIHNSDTPIIFGFCGKMYIGIIHYDNDEYGSRIIIKTYLDIDKYFIDVKKFNYVNNYSILDNFLNIRENRRYRRLHRDRELFNDWLREFHTFKGIDEIFIELNAPIFAIIFYDYKPILRINPCMKDLCLQSSIGPFLAYQEIDMYLNNILITKENKIPKFSDNLIRDSKGFDINSFRKEKRVQ